MRSYTPRHAVNDYLRSLGCSDDELEPVGEDAVAWRGAVYIGVEASEESGTDTSQTVEGA